MLNRKKILPIILISFGNSYAEDITDSSNDLTLDEIKVVATKLTDLPKNDNQFLEESGNYIPPLTIDKPQDTVHSTTQELNNMAGISILGSSQTVSQNISIGGLSQSDVFVAIDGVNNYFSNFSFNQTRLLPSPYLFKQVSATQTGSNITNGSGDVGGAVNFTTFDPEDILQGDKLSTAASIGGNTATMGTNANALLAARTGNVSYLLDVVGAIDNNMQLADGSTLPYSANNNIQALAKIAIDISDSQKLKLSFLNMQNDGQYPSVVNSSVGEDNPPANFTFNQSQSTIDYAYNPNNPYIDLKAQLSYQTSSYSSNPIENTTGFSLPQNTTINTSSLKLNNTTIVVHQKLLYGIEYTNISGEGFNNNETINFPAASQQLYGAYLQDSWDITQKINLTAGTRYNAYQSQGNGTTNANSLFTNQIGLNYKFLPDWLAFIGYSEGFRAPTINDLYLNGYTQYASGIGYAYEGNPNLNPEIAHNKTAGIKYNTWFTSEQHFNASISTFLNDISNYMTYTYISQDGTTTTTQMNNIGAARLYGYVLSLNYTTPWFNLDTNFTNTYGTSLSSYSTSNNVVVPAGSSLPIPQAKGFVGLGFPINPIDSTIQANINYALNQPNRPNYGVPPPDVPGYVLLGLAYKWKGKRHLRGMEGLLGIDNILNENYQNYNGYTLYPGMGRNIYGQISYKY